MKTLTVTSLFFLFSLVCTSGLAQSIIGRWQLIKQTSCLEDQLGEEDEGIQELLDQKNGMSSSIPQVIEFKEKGLGEESTAILYKKKTANKKSFLYKFDGTTLYILDKKSQTIVSGYTVDKLDSDSLILSNSSQACETKVFVRLK